MSSPTQLACLAVQTAALSSPLCGSFSAESRCFIGQCFVGTLNWEQDPQLAPLRVPLCEENVLTFLVGGLVLVAECLEYLGPKSSL